MLYALKQNSRTFESIVDVYDLGILADELHRIVSITVKELKEKLEESNTVPDSDLQVI